MGQTMRVAAIAKELQRRGHEVKFLAGGKLIPIIRGFGLEVRETAALPPMVHAFSAAGDLSPAEQEEISAKRRAALAKIREIEAEAIADEQPDVLICGTMTGPEAAERSGTPAAMVMLQPHGAKTIAMFSRLLTQDPEIQRTALASVAAAKLIFVEGMAEIGGEGEFPVPDMPGFDLSAAKEKIRFTGPLLIEPPDRLPSREGLKQRHIGNSSRPMVYVTIGGGSDLIGKAFLKLVLAALAMLPDVTGVVAAGVAIPPDEIAALCPPPNAIIHGFAPGTEMIKASDATVFHGGSSTLMTCLACGTPAAVVPSMAEQEDNGAVLARHGAGIVLGKETLTANRLAEAIRRLLNDPAYRQNAARLKALGDRYGGAAAAAQAIEQLAANISKKRCPPCRP